VHQQVRALDELAVHDPEADRLAATRALGLDLPVDVESRRDAERVPGARAGPGPAARPHEMWRALEAERVREADVEGCGMENQRVRVIEAPVTRLDLGHQELECGGGLGDGRRASVRDDAEVDVPPDVEINRIHGTDYRYSVVEEARLERYGSGIAPATEGWFVVNVRDAAWDDHDVFGASCMFESPDATFTELGVRLTVLEPGQPNGLYHGEETQEDFLVLSGECLLLVEARSDASRPGTSSTASRGRSTSSWAPERTRA
jgi:hypothetical protein